MLQNLGSGLASTSEGRHYRYFPKEQTVKLCIYTSFFFFFKSLLQPFRRVLCLERKKPSSASKGASHNKHKMNTWEACLH